MNENSIEVSLCRFLLSRGCSKIPIKRADVSSFLRGLDHTLSSSKISDIMKSTDQLLRKVYEFKIETIGPKSNLRYILTMVNTSSDCQFNEKYSPVEEENNKLLLAVLSHIFMSGGSITEDDMWKFLENSNLMNREDVKKIMIKDFTKQAYLNYGKITDSSIEKYVFEWGERATIEIPKMEILRIITNAFGYPIDYWYEQFKIAEAEDAKNFPSSQGLSQMTQAEQTQNID